MKTDADIGFGGRGAVCRPVLGEGWTRNALARDSSSEPDLDSTSQSFRQGLLEQS